MRREQTCVSKGPVSSACAPDWGGRENVATGPTSRPHLCALTCMEAYGQVWCVCWRATAYESQPACLGRQPTTSWVVWTSCVVVCVCLCSIFLSEMPCIFLPPSPEQDGHMVYWLLALPSFLFALVAHRHSRYSNGAFPWNPGPRQRGKDGGPSRITPGARHQKGVDHFRSLVSGYAAQPRQCCSRVDMLVRYY